MTHLVCPQCKNFIFTNKLSCPYCGRRITRTDIRIANDKIRSGRMRRIAFGMATFAVVGAASFTLGVKHGKTLVYMENQFIAQSEERNLAPQQENMPEETPADLVAPTEVQTPKEKAYEHSEAFDKGLVLTIEGRYEDAFKIFKVGVEKGDADSFAGLGLVYIDGIAVKKDIKKGLEFLKKAADMGSPIGKTFLGKVYLLGEYGVRKNKSRGIEYIEQGMKQNYQFAYTTMAEAYETGSGVPKDVKLAIELYEKAESLGNVNARKDIERLAGEEKNSSVEPSAKN